MPSLQCVLQSSCDHQNHDHTFKACKCAVVPPWPLNSYKSQGRSHPAIMVNWDDSSHFICLLAHFCQDWWCIPCWSIKMLKWQSADDNNIDGANTRVEKYEGLLLATNVKSGNARPLGPPPLQGIHECETHQWLLSAKTNTLAGQGKVWRHHDQCWGGCALRRLMTRSSLDSK